MNERLVELHNQARECYFADEFLDMPRKQVERLILAKFAELVRQDAYGLPTIEDASQHWAKVDGAVAWHLIERHADNWADVGKMMDEFVVARVRIEREECAKLCEDEADQISNDQEAGGMYWCAEKIRARGEK